MENNTTRSQVNRKGRKEVREIARIRGIVRKGFQRGRALGYPTANVRLHTRSLREGVYIAVVNINGVKYQGAAFIGAAKTFEVRERKLEVYILDFKKKIYGQWVTVQLLKFVRDNKKFASVSELKKAMKHDVIRVRNFFRD